MHLLATTSRTSSSVPGISGGLKDRVVMWQVRTKLVHYPALQSFRRIFVCFVACLALLSALSPQSGMHF